MSGKKVWLSWLPGDECQKQLHACIQDMQAVGLDVNGAPWVDDLEKAAWTELTNMLSADDGPELWVVAGRQQDLENTPIRYGLSLCAATLQSTRPELKAMLLPLDQLPGSLPTLWQHWPQLTLAPGWAAKLVAAAYAPPTPSPELGFHISVIAHPHIGQWFEVGPAAAQPQWQGAMFGVPEAQAEIAFHAVGSRGQLPEKSVNEYPTQGIKAEIADTAYVANALQNNITDQDAYYIKVKGFPDTVMVADASGGEDLDAHIVQLA